MCQKQAKGLEELRNEYAKEGKNDIKFIIVNKEGAERHIRKISKHVSFPVYQDNKDRGIWKKLKGKKDDIFVYDRCGRLVFPVLSPMSLLGDKLLQWAIKSTYNRNYCRCHLHRRRSRRNRRSVNNAIAMANQRNHRGSSVISMGRRRNSVRHINRTPKCFASTCRNHNQHHRHLLIHKL